MMRALLASLVLALGLFAFRQPLSAQTNPFGEAGGAVSHIGVGLRDIDAERASALKLGSTTGVEVVSVEPGSPAERAGIRAGDVLLSYNSESIVGKQQLGRLVTETPVGRKVKIEYFRDGKVMTVAAITAPTQHSFPAFGMLLSTPEPSWFPAPRLVWTNQRIGIACESLDSQESQLAQFFGVSHGVLVRAVAKDSVAAKAGLRAGDVVLQMGDHVIDDPRDLASSFQQEQRWSKPFVLDVMRDHKPVKLKVSLPDGQE